MKKNVAGQKIGAQMISSADGTAFTGTVTAYVTGDGGTQALGSVGSGVCTHKGNGYHVYAPAQAETNYDLVAVTFIGTGAIPQTIQVFTGVPQSGDNYARIGAPAGASVSADIAAVKAVLPGALVGGRIDASVGDMSGTFLNAIADAYLDRADAIEVGLTPRGSMRLGAAADAGKVSGAGTANVAIRNVGDTKTRISATVDEDGNRTAVTTDVS